MPPALLTCTVDNCSVVGNGGGQRAVRSGGAPPTTLLAMATGDPAMADISVPIMLEPPAVRCRTFWPGDCGGDGSLRRMVPPVDAMALGYALCFMWIAYNSDLMMKPKAI